MNTHQLIAFQFWDGAVNVIPVTATVTGTASGGLTETETRDGGKTLIVTLTGDTYVGLGAFLAFRATVRSNIVSDGSEANGWNAERDNLIQIGDIVRTSDTVMTITLSADAAYDVTANETITITLPAALLTNTSTNLGAEPTFTITADAPAATAVRYGGGPFWSKYGYDSSYNAIRRAADDDEDEEEQEAEEVAQEIRGKLAKKREAQADDAINAAASAILRNAPVIDVEAQERLYTAVVRKQTGIRKELKTAIESQRAFRAEVRKKLQQAEQARKIEAARRAQEEEIELLTVMFMDFDEDD